MENGLFGAKFRRQMECPFDEITTLPDRPSGSVEPLECLVV